MQRDNEYFQKINNSSIVQQVIDSITKAIIKRQLKPGDRIPTEMELSSSLGVGRLSIREAIKVLVYYGVLEIRRPEGTFVCKGFSSRMVDPVIYRIILSDDDTSESLKELRLMTEVGAVKLARRKCTPQGREILYQKYQDIISAAFSDPIDVQWMFDADDAFHHAISMMGDNPMIDKINELTRLLTHEIRYQTVKNMLEKGEGQAFIDAHKALYDIICGGSIDNIDEIVEHGYFYDRINLD
ncbi:MAG: GntR family transcriptional regulator [Clostridia bacterium]|nr:GntR family transcriptional regulator [Clostridia bacterium]